MTQAGFRLRRAVAAAAVGLLVLVGLTSCQPEVKGATGLTVDAAGRPLAALAWCAKRPPTGVRLFASDERTSAGPAPGAQVGTLSPWPGIEYPVPRDAASPATVLLEEFPPGQPSTPTSFSP
ncbi:hypothetical protein ACFOW4_20895 [Micromonospora sp. GCM10011542]|uniref:hypothetical protein n=1 Tax=Micromonospora sp. GCM10011542 TaxID=3317337 RepID=UPI003620F51D